ncbi:hypothetical protein TRM7557_01754 [Tritonibacter multivorans]|uniref:Uncharacterized protein n=1 Tax=Tritonibacter multivorans TaxID=928856 RepID=A0A0P1G9D4_9RHOB|nr:hypothetical protein TRM7557_01754 [Tritonibacter multivorans]SFD76765.1 hypothetical protein SAMN04488049_12810 [Tritonibacter multivorans]
MTAWREHIGPQTAVRAVGVTRRDVLSAALWQASAGAHGLIKVCNRWVGRHIAWVQRYICLQRMLQHPIERRRCQGGVDRARVNLFVGIKEWVLDHADWPEMFMLMVLSLGTSQHMGFILSGTSQ